jgi:hypothetical protein
LPGQKLKVEEAEKMVVVSEIRKEAETGVSKVYCC